MGQVREPVNRMARRNATGEVPPTQVRNLRRCQTVDISARYRLGSECVAGIWLTFGSIQLSYGGDCHIDSDDRLRIAVASLFVNVLGSTFQVKERHMSPLRISQVSHNDHWSDMQARKDRYLHSGLFNR